MTAGSPARAIRGCTGCDGGVLHRERPVPRAWPFMQSARRKRRQAPFQYEVRRMKGGGDLTAEILSTSVIPGFLGPGNGSFTAFQTCASGNHAAQAIQEARVPGTLNEQASKFGRY